MFQNRKIVSNLYETGFLRMFVPRSNPSLLRTVQSQPFWNIGTFLYFQELATPHFGTLWNIRGVFWNITLFIRRSVEHYKIHLVLH